MRTYVREPLYIRISNTLKNEILNGTYPEGTNFPSEHELTARFQVTRCTVRNAVNILVQEGLLHKQQGKRIIVRLSKVHMTSWNFRSFTDGMRSQKGDPFSIVLSFDEVKYQNIKCFELVRIRGIKQGQNIQYLTKEVSRLPCKVFPRITKFDFSVTSLYGVMKDEYNVYPCNGRSHLVAIPCPEDLCEYFELEPNSPIIKASQTIKDNNDRVIEMVDVYYSPYLDIKISREINN